LLRFLLPMFYPQATGLAGVAPPEHAGVVSGQKSNLVGQSCRRAGKPDVQSFSPPSCGQCTSGNLSAGHTKLA